jgi:uncharacterized protein (DUF1800 family)
LTASWNAPAAELVLKAAAGPIANGKATITADYTSSGHADSVIRLYVNGKRWGSGEQATGRFTVTAVPVGTHILIVRADGASPQSSNEVVVQIGSAPVAVEAKRRDAARLLLQASFGPRSVADVDEVASRSASSWLDAQIAAPWNTHAGYLASLRAQNIKIEEQHIFEAIWQNMMFADARLRARVALALSEIMVVSNIAPDQDSDALAGWMDMLYANAFGNYRTLLRDATLQPAMGYYLNMLGNDKEDLVSGRMPSENYAREVLQLFSIGLVELNADGTAKRDASGKTIATYDQNVVQGFAKVFTGWSFGGSDTTFSDGFNPPKKNWTVEMQAWPSHHSAATKLLLQGTVLPAGQTPQRDLDDALDNISNHPNVGPFISKRLIQFLVTSNPSAGYVSRVVAVWNNNGAGARGDLKSVVKSILLDGEARDPATAPVHSSTYGKLREPMVRFVHFANAMGAKSNAGRNSIWWLDSPDDALGQTPLLAASVFNFFSPLYSRAGSIAKAGLASPEFQNATDTQVVGSTNFFAKLVREGGIGFEENNRVDFDMTSWLADSANTSRLVDRINLVLFAGGISANTQTILEKAINAYPANERNNRLQAALNLAVIAPEFVIQR